MSTDTSTLPLKTIILRAAPFLVAVPVLSAIVGALPFWPFASEMAEPAYYALIGMGLAFLASGSVGGLSAFIMAVWEGYTHPRPRIWMVTIAGFLGGFTGLRHYSGSSWTDLETISYCAVMALVPMLVVWGSAIAIRRVWP